jgi:A/G-specific adenine glycosylase
MTSKKKYGWKKTARIFVSRPPKMNKKIIMKPNHQQLASFRDFIWTFYEKEGRKFEWRNVDNPYYVMVSEIMLQQTQTYRVEPKYRAFIDAFPDLESLASASLRDVLVMWQGLGYNRRGKFLHQAAQRIMQEFGGNIPQDPERLVILPGIGKNTAGSISAFAFNKPTIFIETNIRAVFIHSFFKDQEAVPDNLILSLVEQTVDQDNPREWYYALMDYGVHLKKMFPNPSRRSKHHAVQSKFEGSDRQIRGAIIRALVKHPALSESQLSVLCKNDARVSAIIAQLEQEQLIERKNELLLIRNA